MNTILTIILLLYFGAMLYIWKKKKGYGVFSISGGLLTGIALFVQLYLDENGPGFSLNGWGSTQLLTMVLLLFFYHWYYQKGQPQRAFGRWEKGICLTVALLFALFSLVGKSYMAFDEWTLLFGGGAWTFLALCCLTGYVTLFYPLLCLGAEWLMKVRLTEEVCAADSAREGAGLRGGSGAASKSPSKLTLLLFEKHPVLLPMLVILLCQLPYLILFYPGVLSCDADYQIGQVIGGNLFTLHHPPLVAFYYGKFAEWGMSIGNPGLGMYLSVCLQSLLCAFGFGAVFGGMKKLRAPYGLRYAALAFYALLTVWPSFATTLIKDSLYYPLFTIYTLLLILCIKDPTAFAKKKRHFLELFLVVFFMCQVRHNGLYAFLLSFPFLLFLLPKKAKLAGLGLIAALLVCLKLMPKLWVAAGVLDFGILPDTYSVMYQQTARYAKYHGDEVTPEEYEVLDKVFEYAEQPELYDPQISDPVKNKIRRVSGLTEITMAEYKDEYFQVWWQQFLKHPATYAQAYLNGCYGYFYPDCREYKEGLGWYRIWQDSFELEGFDPRFTESSKEGRDFLEELPEMLRQLPGFGMLYSCGFYTWLTIGLTAFLCMRKKWAALIAMTPALSNILICTVSPVNAYLRYMLPVFAVAPILLALAIYFGKEHAACADTIKGNMKKIAFHLNCLAHGGAERVVTNLSAQFAQAGYEVLVATEWQEEQEYALDEKVRRVAVGLTQADEKKNRFAKIFLRYWRLRKFIKKERPDVLIAFAQKANYRALTAAIGTGQKVVACVRTDPVGHYDRRADKIQIPLLFPGAAGFVFQTTGQRDFFPDYVRKKSTIILNPINPKYIGRARVAEREKTVVHSGRLVDFKNHPLLIGAFARVHKKHPDYVLKCYGGDSGDGTLAVIKDCIARLDAADYVQLMGDSDRLEEELEKASVYAFSSDWEGLPNAVLEAMALGLPVVATDCPCGGPRTVIENGKNGLLVPVRDEEALADAICRLIEDKKLAAQLGENAAKISRIANGEAVFAQWRSYLESL